MSSPAKLSSTNGAVGGSVAYKPTGDIRPNKRFHDSARELDGLRTDGLRIVESDNDDDDDDDDSSASEGFTSKRRRSLPSISYPSVDPSGSGANDIPDSKPYIPDFAQGMMNPWQSATGGGIATGIGGRNYNGDNGGGTFGGSSSANNTMFASDISGMLSSMSGGGSNFLTNEQVGLFVEEIIL